MILISFLCSSIHFKFKERLALFLIIRRKDVKVSHFCEHCFSMNHKCVVMIDYKKCAKCVRRDCFCVRLSLETLKTARIKIKIEVSKIFDEQFSKLLSKISRLRKTLNHIEK